MWAILEISMEEGKYVSHFFVVDLYKGNKCYNLFVVASPVSSETLFGKCRFEGSSYEYLM